MPAIRGGIVDFARVGVGQNRLAGRAARRTDERWDKGWGAAIHADRCHLRVSIKECGALRQALRFLRRELGAGAVVTRGDEDVGVDPGRLWCDAVAFEEACTSDPAMAAELYRGDLLVGGTPADRRPSPREMKELRLASEAVDAVAFVNGLPLPGESTQYSRR